MKSHCIVKRVGLSALLVACALLWGTAVVRATESTAPAGGGSLDQQVFVGEMGEQGKIKGGKDEFVFKNGTFRSTACDAYGFSASPYTAATQGQAIAFSAHTVSKTDGKMAWKGTVHGKAVEGTATWYKPGKEPKAYWFKGTVKPSGSST